MSDHESQGTNGLLTAKIKELEIQIADLEARNARLIEQSNLEEEQCNEVHGTLADLCDLAFDDKDRAAVHGYKGVKEKIVDIQNRLTFHKLQVKEFCKDHCLEIRKKQGPCYGCPLGKL